MIGLTKIDGLSWNEIKHYVTILPNKTEKEKIMQQLQEQDRCLGIVGKLLLLHALKKKKGWEKNFLPEFSYNEFKKPSFKDVSLGSFNISHSGNKVACFFSSENKRIGVDIEKIQEIEINDFRTVLTSKEYTLLRNRKAEDFFQLWTKKEALVKAIGMGFHFDPKKIEIEKHCIEDNFEMRLGTDSWHVHTFRNLKGYVLSAASPGGRVPAFEYVEKESLFLM
ncbi:4'-phosphopantetheinyl transferase superfamily protein [Chryseobacterium sp.]|uniref:4'-phosphopantetheinyl transferase family protein n=1 Tax=Chryseobacterium sp. TaxID=1871047 RepID=UPI0025C66B03|nr:4'-phosphopantetheinyl transferase superfamily protein [Chryseobacterium sp.]